MVASKWNTTALERLRNLQDLINTCGYYLGFDILRSDFAIKKKSMVLMMIAIMFVASELLLHGQLIQPDRLHSFL